VTGKTDLREVLPKHLERRWWKHWIDRLIKYWFQSQNSIDGQIVWLVSMLRKQWYACYLVTQQEKHRAEYMRSEMKLDEVFDQIVTTADIWYTKREEEFFTEVCRHLWIEDASQVFFVDDSKKVLDVAGSIWITTFLYDENFAKLYSHIKNLWIDSIRV
jgi:FMN phosphatase YigB (HAD superfamily)